MDGNQHAEVDGFVGRTPGAPKHQLSRRTAGLAEALLPFEP